MTIVEGGETKRGGAQAPILFFSRCKPWLVDLSDLAIKHRQVFFGYPLLRPGVQYREDDPEGSLIPPDGGPEWRAAKPPGMKGAQFSRNMGLVREVGIGSIAMVPRPQDGKIWCGRVSSSFRLSHSPDLIADAAPRYAARGFREGEPPVWGTGVFNLGAELAQGWDVERFVALPLPVVEASIRARMFGRSTYGVVRRKMGDDPVEVIERLMAVADAGRPFPTWGWSLNAADARKRILGLVTPSLLEALVVSILQVEHPHLSWIGVGGSGDGGIDGVAWDDEGRVEAVLQCKWRYDGSDVFGNASPLASMGERPVRRVLAYLEGPPADIVRASGAVDEVFCFDRIVELLLKHHERLPFATTLRIGPVPRA